MMTVLVTPLNRADADLLPNINVLAAISKGMWAVNLLQQLGGGVS